jgi:hypothetical protein
MFEALVALPTFSLTAHQLKLTSQKPIFDIRAGDYCLDLQLMFLQLVLHALQSA